MLPAAGLPSPVAEVFTSVEAFVAWASTKRQESLRVEVAASTFDGHRNHLCAIPNIAELIISDDSSKTPRTDPQTSSTSSNLPSPTQAGPPTAPQLHRPDATELSGCSPHTSVPCSPAGTSSPRPSAVVIRARTLLPPPPDSRHDHHRPSSEAADTQKCVFRGLRSLSGPIHVLHQCRDLFGGGIQELAVQVPPGTLSQDALARVLVETMGALKPAKDLRIEIPEERLKALYDAFVSFPRLMDVSRARS